MDSERKKNWQTLLVWAVLMAGTYFIHGYPNPWWLLGCAGICLLVAGVLVLIWDTALQADRRWWKNVAAVVAILGTAAVVSFVFGRRAVDALLSRSAVIPVWIAAGTWVCLVAYFSHLKLKPGSWRALGIITEIAGMLFLFGGVVLGGIAADSAHEHSALSSLYFMTAVSGFVGLVHLSQAGKRLTGIPSPPLKAKQRSRYVVSVGVTCLMIVVAQFDTPDLYHALLGVTIVGVALYGIRLFWITSRALWSLGHITLLFLNHNLFGNLLSQTATQVFDACALVFLIASALEVIRISPEPDAIPPVGFNVFSSDAE